MKFICLERGLLAYKELKANSKLKAVFKRIETTAKCFNNFNTKQFSRGVLQKCILKNFAKLKEKHLCWGLFLIEAGLIFV